MTTRVVIDEENITLPAFIVVPQLLEHELFFLEEERDSGAYESICVCALGPAPDEPESRYDMVREKAEEYSVEHGVFHAGPDSDVEIM